MKQRLLNMSFIFALLVTNLLPSQTLNACVGAFAAGYGHLFAPGIIVAGVGGGVLAVGGCGVCISGCCVCCAAGAGSGGGVFRSGAAVWGFGATAIAGGLTLVPGIILLDEKPTGFQFEELSEEDRVRLELTENQVIAFNENLTYINAALQKIDQYKNPLNVEAAISQWEQFKIAFMKTSSEAIEVVEILAKELTDAFTKNIEEHSHDHCETTLES